jgi:hypothetical protein
VAVAVPAPAPAPAPAPTASGVVVGLGEGEGEGEGEGGDAGVATGVVERANDASPPQTPRSVSVSVEFPPSPSILEPERRSRERSRPLSLS